MKNIIKLLRVKHYIKNLLIFVPLFFSLKLNNINAVFDSFITFISFCMISSFVYIINDIIDKNKDSNHPKKKFRPIASGKISIAVAYVLAGSCLLISLILARFVNFNTIIVLIIYAAVNLLYTFKLKNIVLFDVLCIATGFILRIIVGSVAISVPLSNWLLLTILSGSFYLAFGKRRNEIISVTDCINTRSVLEHYNKHFLDNALVIMLTLSIVFYTLWTIDIQTIQTLNTDKVIYTVPFFILAMLRYLMILEENSDGDPTDVILSDKPLIALIFIIVLLLTLFIYIL